MGVPNQNLVLRNGGHLYINPTNLTPPGFGGAVQLGIHKLTVAQPVFVTEEISADLEVNGVNDVLYLGESWNIISVSQQWDLDVLSTYYQNYRVDTGDVILTTGTTPKTGGASLLPGQSLPGMVLLFVPLNLNVTNTNLQAVIFYNARPRPDQANLLRLQMINTLDTPVVWTSTADATGRVFEMGPLAKLTPP